MKQTEFVLKGKTLCEVFAAEAEADAKLAKAENQRDLAMAAVADNAGENWMDYALTVIAKIAREKGCFTSDDIMYALEVKPHDCRALGPAMKRAQSQGIIKPAGGFARSTRRHACPITIWEKT